ncbi:MAG: hypothetical protein H7Z10_09295, partial [Gemmatimonadaceae bacterium]|nr:hypothetical protein [Acetobacteraceae bacterium]
MMADGPIEDCLASRISPEVAVARLLLAGLATGGIADALARSGGPGDPRWAAMAR